MDNKLTFEESISNLEEIVQKLSNGNVGLEESIALYEKGIKLAEDCSGKLKQARQKIEMINNDNAIEIKNISEISEN